MSERPNVRYPDPTEAPSRLPVTTILYVKVKPQFPEREAILKALARLAEIRGHGIRAVLCMWWRGDDRPADQVEMMLDTAREITSRGFGYIHGMQAFSYFDLRRDSVLAPFQPEFWLRSLNYLAVTERLLRRQIEAMARAHPWTAYDAEPSDPGNPPAERLKCTKLKYMMPSDDWNGLLNSVSYAARYAEMGVLPSLVFPGSANAEHNYALIVGMLGADVIHAPYGQTAVPAGGLTLRARVHEVGLSVKTWAQNVAPSTMTRAPHQISYAEWRAINWDAIRAVYPELRHPVIFCPASKMADLLDEIVTFHTAAHSPSGLGPGAERMKITSPVTGDLDHIARPPATQHLDGGRHA